MSEETVFQVAINGPAKGQVFERPLSERDVYLPWTNEPVLFANGVSVRLPTAMYNPYHIRLFGRNIWVLSMYPPTDTDLFEFLASDIAKRTATKPAVVTSIVEQVIDATRIRSIRNGHEANQRQDTGEDSPEATGGRS